MNIKNISANISRTFEIKMGLIEGLVFSRDQTFENCEAYRDSLLLGPDEANKKHSPYYHPHLRKTYEECLIDHENNVENVIYEQKDFHEESAKSILESIREARLQRSLRNSSR